VFEELFVEFREIYMDNRRHFNSDGDILCGFGKRQKSDVESNVCDHEMSLQKYVLP